VVKVFWYVQLVGPIASKKVLQITLILYNIHSRHTHRAGSAAGCSILDLTQVSTDKRFSRIIYIYYKGLTFGETREGLRLPQSRARPSHLHTYIYIYNIIIRTPTTRPSHWLIHIYIYIYIWRAAIYNIMMRYTVIMELWWVGGWSVGSGRPDGIREVTLQVAGDASAVARRRRVNVRYGAPDPPGGVARCAALVSITHGSLRFQTLIGSFGDAHAYIYTAWRARGTIIATAGLEIHSARRRRGDESTTTIGSRGWQRASKLTTKAEWRMGKVWNCLSTLIYILQYSFIIYIIHTFFSIYICTGVHCIYATAVVYQWRDTV